MIETKQLTYTGAEVAPHQHGMAQADKVIFNHAILKANDSNGAPIAVHNWSNVDVPTIILHPGQTYLWPAPDAEGAVFSLSEHFFKVTVPNDGFIFTYHKYADATPSYSSFESRLEAACMFHIGFSMADRVGEYLTITRGFSTDLKEADNIHVMRAGSIEQNLGVYDVGMDIVISTNTGENEDGRNTRSPQEAHDERVGLVCDIFNDIYEGIPIERILAGYVPGLYIQENSMTVRPTRTFRHTVEERMFQTIHSFRALCSGEDKIPEYIKGLNYWWLQHDFVIS